MEVFFENVGLFSGNVRQWFDTLSPLGQFVVVFATVLTVLTAFRMFRKLATRIVRGTGYFCLALSGSNPRTQLDEMQKQIDKLSADQEAQAEKAANALLRQEQNIRSATQAKHEELSRSVQGQLVEFAEKLETLDSLTHAYEVALDSAKLELDADELAPVTRVLLLEILRQELGSVLGDEVSEFRDTLRSEILLPSLLERSRKAVAPEGDLGQDVLQIVRERLQAVGVQIAEGNLEEWSDEQSDLIYTDLDTLLIRAVVLAAEERKDRPDITEPALEAALGRLKLFASDLEADELDRWSSEVAEESIAELDSLLVNVVNETAESRKTGTTLADAAFEVVLARLSKIAANVKDNDLSDWYDTDQVVITDEVDSLLVNLILATAEERKDSKELADSAFEPVLARLKKFAGDIVEGDFSEWTDENAEVISQELDELLVAQILATAKARKEDEEMARVALRAIRKRMRWQVGGLTGENSVKFTDSEQELVDELDLTSLRKIADLAGTIQLTLRDGEVKSLGRASAEIVSSNEAQGLSLEDADEVHFVE